MSMPTDDARPHNEAAEARRTAAHAGRSLRNGLIALAVLLALLVALLLAIPGLHGVARQVTHMRRSWLAVAVGLEILSCLGYVLAFLQVFRRVPLRFGARVALTELAFGAAVSLGGAGSLAVGGWLLAERGGKPSRIAERSAVLFLLTSAINVITLALAALGLLTGVLPGPRNPLLSAIPAAVGIVVLLLFLALPWLIEPLARIRTPGRVRALLIGMAESIHDTEHLLFMGDWRIVGAIGYLWFDIAVLMVCFAAAGHVPPLAPVVLAYQIGYLVNFLPVPGNVGVLDASFVGLLVLYGVHATVATAATIVYHAISLWVPALWGTIAFIILRRSRGEPVTLRGPR